MQEDVPPLLIAGPQDSTGEEDILKVEPISKTTFKLTLTRDNRADLFSHACSRLSGNREEAELILRNLKRWAPEAISSSFSLRTPDVVLDTPFRLICSRKTGGIPFDGPFRIRQFLAVSYCWYGEKWPPAELRCTPHHPWPISKRFARAVLRERGHFREGIWMDQLCINQDNEREKRMAIASMDIIYQSCRKLLVLLEDVALTEDEVGICVKYDLFTSDPKTILNPPDEVDIPIVFSFFDKVRSAWWWKRSWCFHEFAVAEPWSDKRHIQAYHTTFIMGRSRGRTVSIGWLTIHRLLAAAAQLRPDTILKFPTPILGMFDNATSPYKDALVRKEGSTRASILTRYNATAQTSCSVATDRLAVMININGLAIAYIGKKISFDEVYFLGAALVLAAGEEAPLFVVGDKAVQLRDRPSWLSWPHMSGFISFPRFTLKSFAGIHRLSMHALELDMVFFGIPDQGATREEIEATHGIFPGVIPSTPPSFKYWSERVSSSHSHSDKELDSPRRCFLASVMAMDAAAVGRLWRALYRDIIKVKFDTSGFSDIEPNQTLRPQAESFLSHISSNPTLNGGALFDLNSALLFLTCLTDPRWTYFGGLITTRIRCTKAGDYGILSDLTIISHFTNGGGGEVSEIKLAMPADLMASSCLPRRMWLLRPVAEDRRQGRTSGDEQKQWRVVGKAMLLGEPNLQEELDFHGNDEDRVLTLRRNQVIVG